jgi:hypothetical protein
MENWNQRRLLRDNYNKESETVGQASFGWQFCPAFGDYMYEIRKLKN